MFLLSAPRATLQLHLDALRGIEAQHDELELHERHRRHPGFEAIDRFERNAEAVGFLLDLLEFRLADGLRQRAVAGVHAVLDHPALGFERIEVVEIDFHDQRGRRRRTPCRRRQGASRSTP